MIGKDPASRAPASDEHLRCGQGRIAGLAGALWFNRVIASLLFATPSADPLTFTAVSCLLILAGALACLIPSVRATGIDPILTLRRE